MSGAATAPRPRRLIVNADDYGASSAISQGIREAHLRGIVTSTTAMMNMPGAAEELATARRRCLRLALGVHLNASEGRPLTDAARIPSLVDAAGCFRGPGHALFSADPEDVEREFQAQIERFIRVAGRPTHLDSHHHLAMLVPRCARVAAALAGELGVPWRAFPSAAARAAIDPALGGFHEEVLGCGDALGLPRVDHFETGFCGAGATLENLVTLLRQLPAGTSELMCHPAAAESGSVGSGSVRVRELAILCDPRIRAELTTGSIELVSYACLARSS